MQPEISDNTCILFFSTITLGNFIYSSLRIIARFSVARKSVQLSGACNYTEGNILRVFFLKINQLPSLPSLDPR